MSKPAKPFTVKLNNAFSLNQLATVSSKSGQCRRAYRQEPWRPKLKNVLKGAATLLASAAVLVPLGNYIKHRNAVITSLGYIAAQNALATPQTIRVGGSVMRVDQSLINSPACTNAQRSLMGGVTCEIPDPTDPTGTKMYTVKANVGPEYSSKVITNRDGKKHISINRPLTREEKDTLDRSSPTSRAPQPKDREFLSTASSNSAQAFTTRLQH